MHDKVRHHVQLGCYQFQLPPLKMMFAAVTSALI